MAGATDDLPRATVDIDIDNRSTAHELEPIHPRIGIEFRAEVIATGHTCDNPLLNFVQRQDLASLTRGKGAILVALTARVGGRRQGKAGNTGRSKNLHQHGLLHGLHRLNRQ